jgi:endoglucanase
MVWFRHVLGFAAGALLLLTGAAGARADSRDLLLHQEGTNIVDAKGRLVRLRGFNLGGWLSWEGWIFGRGILTSETDIRTRLDTLLGAQKGTQFRQGIYRRFITEADIQQIADAGFNSVRVPLNYRLFDKGAARAVYQEQGWALLDQLLGWCQKHHVYVVLDLHAAPGGQSVLAMADPGDAPMRLWLSEEHRAQTVALWRALAERYKDRPMVAGYDLLNEPASPTGADLMATYGRIIAAVREVDANHMIFIEGDRLASDFSKFQQPPCRNMVYSFHMYTLFGDDRARRIAGYQAMARQQKVPLWVGEFGENSYAMMESTVKMFSATDEIAGWSFWTWKKAPTSFPGAAVVKVPAEWDGVMKWVVNPVKESKPDAASADRGMHAFLDAVAIPNVQIDERMLKAVRGD